MSRSHLHVKPSVTRKAVFTNWNVTWLPRGNYRVYVAVTGCTWQPSSTCYVSNLVAVTPVTGDGHLLLSSNWWTKLPAGYALTGKNNQKVFDRYFGQTPFGHHRHFIRSTSILRQFHSISRKLSYVALYGIGKPGGGGALPYWRWRGRAAGQGMILWSSPLTQAI